MTTIVDEYLAKTEGEPGEIAVALYALLRRIAPELEESMKWNQPVFSADGPVCYFRAGKKHVTFGFWRGVSLRKLSPRIETSSEMMAHIKLRTRADIDEKEITKLVTKAIELNRIKGDPLLEMRRGLVSG